MPHRHFGLGHLSSKRTAPRPYSFGLVRQLLSLRRELSFRAGNWAERAFQRAYDGIPQRSAEAANIISEGVAQVHAEDTYTSNATASHQVRVTS